MQTWINDNSKPVIFLGSSYNMYKLTEVCDDFGIEFVGIIDSDYYGNTKTVCDIPVIDTETTFDNSDTLSYYRDNFNFFNAVNWSPEQVNFAIRNTQKRKKFNDLTDQHRLNCVSLIDPSARVSKYSQIGRGVYVDAHVILEAKTVIGDYTNIYYSTCIGHDTTIGKNCVIQRQCLITSSTTVEDDCYFGLCVKALKPGARFSHGTFIHEGIYIRRGTTRNEIVSMNSINQSRLVWQYVD